MAVKGETICVFVPLASKESVRSLLILLAGGTMRVGELCGGKGFVNEQICDSNCAGVAVGVVLINGVGLKEVVVVALKAGNLLRCCTIGGVGCCCCC